MTVIYAHADSSSCRRRSLLQPTTVQSKDEGEGRYERFQRATTFTVLRPVMCRDALTL